jgi:hypothetical protein
MSCTKIAEEPNLPERRRAFHYALRGTDSECNDSTGSGRCAAVSHAGTSGQLQRTRATGPLVRWTYANEGGFQGSQSLSKMGLH